MKLTIQSCIESELVGCGYLAWRPREVEILRLDFASRAHCFVHRMISLTIASRFTIADVKLAALAREGVRESFECREVEPTG